MFERSEAQVLVVGAGPVGLFSALSLTERGLSVRIVDEELRTAAHSYALALHPHTIKVLADLGLGAELVDRGYRVNKVAFYDGNQRRAELDMDTLACEHPYMLVLPQSALEGLLEQRLAQKGVKVQWNHSVSNLQSVGDSAVAVVDQLGKVSGGYAASTTEWVVEKSTRVRAAFVVGADGHRSIVRRSLGADYQRLGDPAFYAVFEFHSGADFANEVRIVLDDETTNVLWPLPGGRCRWSFQLTDAEVASSSRFKSRLAVQIGGRAYPQLEPSSLQEMIERRAPWFGGEIGEMSWSMAVRFERRLVDGFGRDQFWLAGDSAHMASPIGGHSMNVGIREAQDLADAIAATIRNQRPPALLQSYNEQRIAEWRQLLQIDGPVAVCDDADSWVKQRGDRIPPCIPAAGTELHALANQIGIELDSGA